MDLQKIKIGDKVEINWREVSPADPDQYDEHHSRFTDRPHQDLIDAMQALKGEALRILELPTSYGESAEVISVSLSYPNDIMGAVITLKKTLRETNSPATFNTPYLPSCGSHENDDGPMLSFHCVKALDLLEIEAAEYLNGKRAQMELELTAEGEAA